MQGLGCVCAGNQAALSDPGRGSPSAFQSWAGLLPAGFFLGVSVWLLDRLALAIATFNVQLRCREASGIEGRGGWSGLRLEAGFTHRIWASAGPPGEINEGARWQMSPQSLGLKPFGSPGAQGKCQKTGAQAAGL